MKKQTNYTLAFIAIIGIVLCIFTLAIINNSISAIDLLLTVFVSAGLYAAFEMITDKI